ncbi:MAG TPA: antibiotic biosynthesis monooxygenase [Dehalococcoidia bacterium]|nr:antibiotic biosynthesis monooxygenase [Dehalococcoidia bacterium]
MTEVPTPINQQILEELYKEELRNMIGVVTHHWAKPDQVDAVKVLLDGNGLAQSKAPGFGSRQTLYSLSDPTKITTLVTWDSNEIYDAWRASPQRAVAMAGAGELWAKPPESERFEVAD